MRKFGRVLAGALITVGLVASAGMVASANGDRHREIVRLINQADNQVRRARPACRYDERLPKPAYSDGTPSDELLDTLGVLRRPQTAEEARIARSRPTRIPAKGIYRRYVRVVHSANGRTFLILPARNTGVFRKRPDRCLVARKRRFSALIADRPASFRRAARRVLARATRQERRADVRGPSEGVFVFDKGPNIVVGGGGLGASQIRRTGMFMSSSRGGRRSVLSGLVPDPVASLTAVFPRRVSRGPGRPPKRYARTVRRTIAVQENVVSLTVPRPAQDAFPTRMIWRDEDGEVVRTVDHRR